MAKERITKRQKEILSQLFILNKGEINSEYYKNERYLKSYRKSKFFNIREQLFKIENKKNYLTHHNSMIRTLRTMHKKGLIKIVRKKEKGDYENILLTTKGQNILSLKNN
jgi:hypothetical protein